MDVIVKVRDPDENLEEKIKAYKVKKRIKTAVTILAFVFALISSYLLVKLQTYTSLRTLQSYKNKETESSDLNICNMQTECSNTDGMELRISIKKV